MFRQGFFLCLRTPQVSISTLHRAHDRDKKKDRYTPETQSHGLAYHEFWTRTFLQVDPNELGSPPRLRTLRQSILCWAKVVTAVVSRDRTRPPRSSRAPTVCALLPSPPALKLAPPNDVMVRADVAGGGYAPGRMAHQGI